MFRTTYYWAYAQGGNSVINALGNVGVASESEMVVLQNCMDLLQRIEHSLRNDLPVILFEADSLGGDGVTMYLADYTLDSDSDSLNSFIVHTDPYHMKTCHFHYVTITGMIIDNVQNNIAESSKLGPYFLYQLY